VQLTLLIYSSSIRTRPAQPFPQQADEPTRLQEACTELLSFSSNFN
jgi:hypothetical protein